ncbi:MAG: CPBP family intramembrane glutamic endopeptidase [Pseudomonadota bacterium]
MKPFASDARISRLAAGGTLIQPAGTVTPRLARRIWLIAELGLFYVGAPLFIAWAIFRWNVPLFLALQPILIGFILYLLWDDTFSVRRELGRRMSLKAFAAIIGAFIVIGGGITLATLEVFPERFLGFPIYRTELWLFVMFAYPIMSVLPQELVYRTFFFHRYGPLFGEARWLAILVNGLAFGFGHIIFGNWIAVVGTTVIGLLLACRYEQTKSFQAIWLEHSLYGCLVFTVGLGRFFFTGVSNVN